MAASSTPVAIIMGSRSDWPTMKLAADRLDQLGRLLIVTRQMDMLMASEQAIKTMADNFMAGRYH